MILDKAITSPKGYLTLVLHAHLPFVRHPECDYVIEENWLFEAITETYLPLLAVFENCIDDNVPFRVTMSITPTLSAMLADEMLNERYEQHLNRLISLAKKDVVRLKYEPAQLTVAKMYLNNFLLWKLLYTHKYQRNLINAFCSLQERGVLEIITCGATHGFFPNMQNNKNAVRAQIQVAKQSYNSFFNTDPKGIWLPECGYYPELEQLLDEAGLRFFFTDTHGLLFAEPQPKYGVYAPIYCGDTTVAAFARDVESSKSVWSSKIGYPGDHYYRDFYRDIGFDLDFEYIKDYIDPNGTRIHTGIKYHRITGETKDKAFYEPLMAFRRANVHAGNFMFNRQEQIINLASLMDRRPIVVAPYDAELFGHWWYEGPYWINYLIRKIAFEQNTIELITPSDYLNIYTTNQVSTPAFSSWGEDGYSSVWLNSTNDWIYRHLHICEKRMVKLANAYKKPNDIQRRTLNQCVRELMLAESSDWAFIMKTNTCVEYATRRTQEHISNFNKLYNDLTNDKLDSKFISLCEFHNNIFPDVDYSVYA